ncbi:dipeptidyl peptidase IV N-terminal region-domain-containing protein [Halteromyces radiatus]|uniref:dipeptidyl peptidase IV N-terminal region-domain-containing protein n=1 Tax=Halteromyces radiatus TaxID=101107 RepID=UPI0022200BD1|nr:dipeptidyl peptidase IV N-terminal region-domain-containing protein [Halteromyces radiatus]KAI8098851.1 dipeptidyl peptidase IV N-terminal region-domain-containing protein [Halteromyces radiatus]
MPSMMENHRREYSDDDDFEDEDQAKGLLNSERTSSSMPRHYQHGIYYPEDEENSYGDLENGNDSLNFGKRKKKIVTCTCISLVGILAFAWIIWSLAMGQMFQIIAGDSHNEYEELKRIDMNDLYNSSFIPQRPTLVWVEQDAQDGVFTYRDPQTNDILLEAIEDGSSRIYVEMKDLQIENNPLNVERFEVSQDAQYLMLYTNVTKQFRWSYKANIYIYHLSSKSITPLNEDTNVNKPPRVSYAAWSPTGHQLVYVMENDIYVANLDKQTHSRVTYDGSPTIFNGVPDWVYEEEVFGKEYSLWWSPDSTHLAYLRFNETDVPEYQVPLYTTSNVSSYPTQLKIKYPKAGSPNPLVSLHIHSVSTMQTIMVTKNATAHPLQASSSSRDFEDDDRLITDVIWATDTSTHLVYKQTNRVQDHELTNLVSLASGKLMQTKVDTVREYKPTDGGWIDVGQSMVYLPSNKHENDIQYSDLADNEDGYSHLAIVTIDKRGQHKVSTKWLTSGDWEVVAGSIVVDKVRQLVHFISTERSFLERHLYTVSLKDEDPASTKICLTCSEDPDEHAYYSVNFSPKAGYYILNYLGPDIPRTVVRKVDNSSFEAVLNDNADLRRLLDDYQLPRIRMSTVKSGSINMPAMEVLPPDFDSTKKYPVLFHVYGGPGSQLVSYTFALDWHTFVASQLGFIVVTVDGRGTGYQGRQYRSVVRGKLGDLETVDQVNAARHWANLDYVDSSRIAIWGWSYGGYMTTKVIEADDGVFATGMAVAPVTDWHFYDSIYTERYMLTPDMNMDGYQQSAVNNMTGFDHAKYLLIHGTGDDNVHFQHSAVLVDKLTLANIHNYRVQFYPDSNHRINYHNANANVYHLLTEFLFESFGGKDYAHLREETHGHFSGSLEHLHH